MFNTVKEFIIFKIEILLFTNKKPRVFILCITTNFQPNLEESMLIDRTQTKYVVCSVKCCQLFFFCFFLIKHKLKSTHFRFGFIY